MADSKVMPALSGVIRYRLPDIDPPPRGVKLIILTSGGVAIVSDWSDDSNHTAWHPLPMKPLRHDGGPEFLTEEPDHG